MKSLLRMSTILCITIFIKLSLQAKPTKVILRDVESTFDERYCNITTHHDDSRPGEIYSLSYRLDLLIEIRTLFVRVGIALPTASGKFDSFIQNTVLDVCKYFKNANNNLMLKLFFNGQFGKKKFPSACPIKPDSFFIENFRVNEKMLTVRATETKFLVTVDLCTKPNQNGKLYCFLTNKFYGEVKERSKWQQEVDTIRQNKNKN